MLLIFILLHITSSQTLVYSAFTTTTLTGSDNWKFLNIDPSNIITQCGSEDIIGGHNKFAKEQAATKLLQLPPHYRMRISLTLYVIDSWDGIEFFQVYVDQLLVYNVKYSGLDSTAHLCGQGSRKDSIYQISKEFNHTGLTVFIYLTTTLDDNSWDESWGFKNFNLFLFLCPPGCLTCNSQDRDDVDCDTWILAHSSYTGLIFDNFITDGWAIINGDQNKWQCHTIPTICGKGKCGKDTQLSLTLSNLPAHAQMKVKLMYLRVGSWEWDDNFKTTVGGEVIWESPLTSLPNYLYGICDQTSQDVLINIDMVFPNSARDPTVFILNNLNGPYSDESFGARDIQIFIKRTICGDKVVELQEQCDDGNLFPFDGCFGCMFQCVDGCSVCQDMICLDCFEGWTYLEYEYSCEKQMDSESSCNSCQMQCSDHCLQCNQGICQVCENNYLLEDNYCFQVEKINLCQAQCQVCIDNICYKCQPGQILILGQCQDICGDQIAPYTLMECTCDLNCEECVNTICYSCKKI